jgi:toxin ParE1/3/4
MIFRVARRAQADLEGIGEYIISEGGNLETAERFIRSIATRFGFLAENPHAGRARDDLGPGRRSFPADRYLIVYRLRGSDVLILRVVHGSRDLPALFARG